jgi:carboxypeptidase C (cathepsin A)
MVYLEQPSGTGFSYSDTADDYKTNDAQSTIDNYITIQEFMKRFPEKAANPLYTTSESYGGHFMPLIAQRILSENKVPTLGYSNKLNFKGFAVGNPFTNADSEYPAMFYTYWGHQLLPKTTWDLYQKECIDKPKIKVNFTECEVLEVRMGTEVGNLNPYAVDYPVCVEDSVTGKKKRGVGSRQQMVWALNFMLPDHLKSVIMPTTNENYEPCEEDYNVAYLNRADVKAAIHVKSDLTWEECSYDLRYNMADRLISMVPVYQDILSQDANLNILVYSGDDDAVCGTIGTQEWVWSLGYSPYSTEYWKTWMYNGQVAGFATKFDTSATNNKLAFVTVHKAGHEVPAYVPAEGFDLFDKYLNGFWFQTTN